jgi:hypothetical protein
MCMWELKYTLSPFIAYSQGRIITSFADHMFICNCYSYEVQDVKERPWNKIKLNRGRS